MASHHELHSRMAALLLIVASAAVTLTEASKFGIGLVNEGSSDLIASAADLVGEDGYILFIFAGMDKTRTAPDASWIASVQAAQAAGLNVVLRLSPGWGSSHFRDESDDAQHLNYTSLANAYAATVDGLSLAPNRSVYIQIHNEPDLCYEWFCGTAGPAAMPFAQTASEYAHFASQVADAIHNLGDDRLQVGAAGLAPGGCIQCGCCGQANCPGDQPGITGLQFMAAMSSAVPTVWDRMDFLASHSYPASGVGFGFNVPFSQAKPGLLYFEQELTQINRSLPVLLTETGWASHRAGMPSCSETDKATWYVQAYREIWLPDTRVQAVLPFMLEDSTWGDTDGYAFVLTDGTKQPCFNAVRQLRCSLHNNTGGC